MGLPIIGQIVLGTDGTLISGSLKTSGITLLSGGATFYDFDNGNLYFSALYQSSNQNVIIEMDGVMNSAKDTISGIWGDWLGNSGTVVLKKLLPPVAAIAGGDGGG